MAGAAVYLQVPAGGGAYMARNDILINGKTLAQIEEELSEPFPREKTKYNGNGETYFPVEVYEERLIEVLGGRRWFNTDCSPAQISQVGERYVVSVSVTVDLLSDNNESAWRKSAAGGSNVIIVNSTGEAKSLKSDVKSAMSEALKNVYQQFGIGIGQLRQMKKSPGNPQNREPARSRDNTGSRPVRSSNQASPSQPKDTEVRGSQNNSRERKISVRFLSRFNSMSGGYSADVICVETGEKQKLVIFKDSVPAIEKYCTMAKFIEHYGKDTSLTFWGYDNIYRGMKQFVFKRPDLKMGDTAVS